MSPTYETLAEAAERIGVSENTLRRRIADGSLPAVRVGPRLIRIDRRDTDALLRPIPSAAA